MSLSRTENGLLVPEGAHEEAVRDALRRHDPELRLVPQDSDYYGQRVYSVYRYMGPDRDAIPILFWGDQQGNPYPLSNAIVDAVQLLDRTTVGRVVDPDVKNAELRERRQRDFEEDVDELVREYEPILEDRKRSPLFRGKSLQLARMRSRDRLPKELRP